MSEKWSMSDERAFFENLYNQRLNFFLVVCSLVVAGAVASDTEIKLTITLGFGLFLVTIQGLSLYRACHKLLLILQLLHETEGHPVKTVGIEAAKKPWPLSFSINHLTGVVLPIGSFLFFAGWFLSVVFKC